MSRSYCILLTSECISACQVSRISEVLLALSGTFKALRLLERGLRLGGLLSSHKDLRIIIRLNFKAEADVDYSDLRGKGKKDCTLGFLFVML